MRKNEWLVGLLVSMLSVELLEFIFDLKIQQGRLLVYIGLLFFFYGYRRRDTTLGRLLLGISFAIFVAAEIILFREDQITPLGQKIAMISVTLITIAILYFINFKRRRGG